MIIIKGGILMKSLKLSSKENAKLKNALEVMERSQGSEYNFVPTVSEFSCKCSGPAQSCVWH